MSSEKREVYPYSFQHALDYNEVDTWKLSLDENNACKNYIENIINENFDGMHLGFDCAKKVIDKFGYKRTAFVLANSIQMKNSDGRFSRENKKFANEYYFADRLDHRDLYAVGSHPAVLDGFVNQYHKEYGKLKMFDISQCIETHEPQDYTNKVVVVKKSELAEEYFNGRDQIYLATSGFGCEPNKIGRAVFATCLGDGTKVRWDRSQIMGVLKDEYIPEYAREKLIELENLKQSTSPLQSQTML